MGLGILSKFFAWGGGGKGFDHVKKVPGDGMFALGID